MQVGELADLIRTNASALFRLLRPVIADIGGGIGTQLVSILEASPRVERDPVRQAASESGVDLS